jgi:membrane protease YdiL (CAAX protease family)
LSFAFLVFVLEALTFLARLDRDLTPFVVVLIPPAAALVVLGLNGDKGEIRELFGRLGRWRVDARWYLAAIGIPLVEKLGVDLVGLAVGATTPRRLTDALTASALVVPLVVIVPALLEELGWRGFGVQTAVDGGHSPAWAVVGLMFILAHVPFYLPGQLYDGLPLWPAPIWLLAGSALLTWIYLRTGSVLLAGLMHAALNGTVPLTWGLDPAWVWQARAGVLSVIAVVVVLVSGRQWWLSASRSRAGDAPSSVDATHTV